MIPVTPFRAYDTGPNEPAVGVAAGKVFNGTTRRIDLHPPAAYEAALVNITYDDNAGAGFVRLWGTQALRPPTSSLNADAPATIGANAAIVPLDSNGRFMLESALTSRIIVDVMAWFDDTGGAVSVGRFVALAPQRLVDTRIAAGTALGFGERQPVHAPGRRHRVRRRRATRGAIGRHRVGGRPVDRCHRRAGPGRIRRRLPDRHGVEQHLQHQRRRGRHPRQHGRRAARHQRTRVGQDAQHRRRGRRCARLHHVRAAPRPSTSGRYSSIDSVRVVDTRVPTGFTRLGEGTVSSVTIPNAANASGRRPERDGDRHRRARLGRHLPGVGDATRRVEPELRRHEPDPRRARVHITAGVQERQLPVARCRPISSSTSSARSLRNPDHQVVSVMP